MRAIEHSVDSTQTIEYQTDGAYLTLRGHAYNCLSFRLDLMRPFRFHQVRSMLLLRYAWPPLASVRVGEQTFVIQCRVMPPAT